MTLGLALESAQWGRFEDDEGEGEDDGGAGEGEGEEDAGETAGADDVDLGARAGFRLMVGQPVMP